MSYLEFKVNLEIAYVDTFEKDDWVQEQYQKYLTNFNNTQKKRESTKHSPFHSPSVKKANNPKACR